MSSLTYTAEEIISSSELVRNLKSYLDQLKGKKIKKFAISRNNKIEAVMISTEALKEFDELLEHMEIWQIVEKRKHEKGGISLNDLKKKYNV